MIRWHKTILVLAVVAIGIVAAIQLVPSKASNLCPPLSSTQVIIDEQHTWSVGVAQTPEERQRGFMRCPAIPPRHGLWFVFDEPVVANFWMKDTLVPLDLLWIADGKIVGIERGLMPAGTVEPIPIYEAPQAITAVLEVPAGEAEELATGMTVRLVTR